jgi:hypothetical protein
MQRQPRPARERPGYFWDVDITHAEVEQILEGDDSTGRRWVVRRVLEYAPPKEALRLLTLKDIESALKEGSLGPVAERRWRAYLEHRRTPR